MSKSTGKNIFLSYGHDEFADFAGRLKNDLTASGYNVWFDQNHLTAGRDWESYIEEGLNLACADKGRFLLLMTPHSVRRPNGYCLNELARALERGLPVLPVMLASCEPPLSICRLQWLDMRNCVPVGEREELYQTALDRLKEALERSDLDFQGVQANLVNALQPLNFDAEIRPHLHRFIGREWVFERIDTWLASDKRPKVLWLTGRPGFGKTALAAWYCYHRREVAAMHFCRFGHTEKADPRRAVLSIAYQLSSQYPDYQTRLNSLDLAALANTANAATLFDVLIVQQLPTTSPHPERKALIVIDGLDEATANRANPLAKLIASEFARVPDWLRLLVTSRPEPEIKNALQAFTPYVLDKQPEDNQKDLKRFIVQEYSPFARNHELPDHVVTEILKRSEGIFLYLEWVRSELAAGRLSLGQIESFPQGLGEVYAQFFARQFPDENDFQSRIRPVLEAVVAAQEALAPDFLARLFSWSVYDKKKILVDLGSLFVDMIGQVQPFHRSLVEWLTDENDDKAGPYFVSKPEGDCRLAEAGWKDYEADPAHVSIYFLKHLASHLAAAGRQTDLARLLLDFTWIKAKVDATDIYSLLDDYEFVTPGSLEAGESVEMVQEALRRSANVLGTRKNELPSQVIGRLLAFDQIEIRRLLDQASACNANFWLKPLRPNLTPPDSSLMGTYTEPAGTITAVTLTPDGRTIIYAVDNGYQKDPALKIWRFDEDEPPVEIDDSCGIQNDVAEPGVGPSRVFALALSPDGLMIASAGDHRVSIWPLGAESNQKPRTLVDLPDSVEALEFVGDAVHLMIVYHSRQIQLWDLTEEVPVLSRTIVWKDQFPRPFYSGSEKLAIAPEVNLLFTASAALFAATLQEYDIETQELIRTYTVNDMTKIAVTPDATRFVCGLTNLEVWDRTRDASQPTYTLPGHAFMMTALAITPDGKRIVSAATGELRVWNPEKKSLRPVPMGREVAFVNALAITSEGRYLIAIHQGNIMRTWDLGTLQLSGVIELPMNDVTILSTGNGYVILGSALGVHYYDVASGKMIREITSPVRGATIAMTPDGTRAVTEPGKLVIWEISSGQVLLEVGSGENRQYDDGFTGRKSAVAFYPDGNRLVTNVGHSLIIWDLLSQERVSTLKGHRYWIDTVAVGLTPEGLRIVSGSHDQTVRIWDPDHPEPLQTLTDHTYTVGGVGILPGGRSGFSCGDSKLIIWNMLSGQLEATFTADSPLTKVACTPDGKMLIAGDLAGQIHFLDLVSAGAR